jgi:hypothetical protein
MIKRFPVTIFRRSFGAHQCLRHASPSEEELSEQVLSVSSNDQLPEPAEEELQKICNKSKLRADHLRIYYGEHPRIPDEEKPQYMRTLKWQRKLIGTCGFEGQYDPGICFATKEEVRDLTEYEKVAFDVPLLEIRRRELEKLDRIKKERYERENAITEALAKQEQWKAKIRARMDERNEIAEAAKAEKARLLEEVRRYFGYTIDPKDEKFQIILAMKEREVAKEKRQERKKQKEQQFLEKLASLEVGTEFSSSKKKSSTKETKKAETDA